MTLFLASLFFFFFLNRQVREVRTLIFGGARATLATLGSSKGEEPLFAVLIRTRGTYILPLLCLYHQFGARERVPFQICHLAFHSSGSRGHKRGMLERVTVTQENSILFLESPHPHTPPPPASVPSAQGWAADRTLGGMQPLGCQRPCHSSAVRCDFALADLR